MRKLSGEGFITRTISAPLRADAENLSVSYAMSPFLELRNGSQSRILYGPGYGLYILKGTEYVLLKPFVSGVF